MSGVTTVLVVDDEPIVREVVVRYLRREGYRTLEAGDGDAAKLLVDSERPDLVVLDLMLPGTDGLAVCRWIRSRSDLPVIMLTARGEEADRIVGLELGADDYVTKPFSPRELAARVRTVLRRAEPEAVSEERLSFDGLVIALGLRLLPTVRLQLAGLAFLAVVLPLTAVLLSGWVMFHMGDDVKILAVAATSASAAVLAALLLARSIASAIDRLRDSSVELAAGDLAARAPERGPRELAELARSFNEMAANLSRLFEARRELVAWASHDLRTPIASLQAMLEAVEDGLADPDRYLPAMHEQVRVLARLVDDLFELARIDAGALTLELREAELAGLIESCVRGLEAEAQSRHVQVESRVENGTRARCEPEKVQRVLHNLLTNALRHTPSDGSVAVFVEPQRDEVHVIVEDSGDGLSPEAAARMFERFWRGDAARTSGKAGAGLGLAIARGLVEAHGGRIWAETRPGGGTRVSFTLPAAV